uniref:PDZ domain-containing protein n=1 Tax=Guillardia theta TaxID=55529 RepID=A0A7S4U8Y6_GUITH|mmetsp:Transcript_42449/g.133718  ORF Transcript_42449/g.133718 Transcript_42449/m.133718 type:complete len:475 (+) Transcript_42449:163-1587(+)
MMQGSLLMQQVDEGSANSARWIECRCTLRENVLSVVDRDGFEIDSFVFGRSMKVKLGVSSTSSSMFGQDFHLNIFNHDDVRIRLYSFRAATMNDVECWTTAFMDLPCAAEIFPETDESRTAEKTLIHSLGIELHKDKLTQRLVVSTILADSLVSRSGPVQEGDVLERVNGGRISDAAELLAMERSILDSSSEDCLSMTFLNPNSNSSYQVRASLLEWKNLDVSGESEASGDAHGYLQASLPSPSAPEISLSVVREMEQRDSQQPPQGGQGVHVAGEVVEVEANRESDSKAEAQPPVADLEQVAVDMLAADAVGAKDKSAAAAPLIVRKARLGSLVEVKGILERENASVHSTDNKGNSVLAAAAANGHLNIVKLLLRYNANINACNQRGQSPLFLALKYGYTDVAEFLLQNRADSSLRDDEGLDCFEACNPLVYESQTAQLASMGFTERRSVLKALLEKKGLVLEAVGKLVSEQS